MKVIKNSMTLMFTFFIIGVLCADNSMSEGIPYEKNYPLQLSIVFGIIFLISLISYSIVSTLKAKI